MSRLRSFALRLEELHTAMIRLDDQLRDAKKSYKARPWSEARLQAYTKAANLKAGGFIKLKCGCEYSLKKCKFVKECDVHRPLLEILLQPIKRINEHKRTKTELHRT